MSEAKAGLARGGEQLPDDLAYLGQSMADQVDGFVFALREIAASQDQSRAVPLLLLEVSQLLLAGGRLAAYVDIVPAERFEPDSGPDPDMDLLREELAELLGGADEYAELFDPYQTPPEMVTSRLSDDLTDIASAVIHGLRHYLAGNLTEALWWWQFSYVASWGSEASAALRALQSVISHDRLDEQ